MPQIPGQFITSVGGLVGITPFGGTLGANGNTTPEFTNGAAAIPPPPAAGSTQYLDCKDWSIQKHPFYDDTTHTGSFGGQNMDITAEGWSATVNITVDQGRPPDMLARYGFFAGKNNGVASQFGFNLGVRAIFIQGAGVNYPSDTGVIDFWWCASAKIGPVSPVIDANSKKMVAMSLTLMGNTRMYKLPAEYNLVADFIAHLQTRGWVF